MAHDRTLAAFRIRRVRIPLVTRMNDVSRHYTRGDLLSRLNAALTSDRADPQQPTADALAPYDHFHGRGLDATVELADLMPARAGDHVLDIGSGIGGPARYVATRFDCRVTGIDLTAEFCDVARHLTRLAGLFVWGWVRAAAGRAV